MALVKMTRDFPECAGGNTTADIPEEAVNLAMDNGWRLADKPVTKPSSDTKSEEKTEEKKPDVKVEAPKAKTQKRDL